MEIGILIVIIGIVAIVYMFITAELEHRKKTRKGDSFKSRKMCCDCKYYERISGQTSMGNCLFFFKTFHCGATACHRWKEKGVYHED